LQQMGTNGEKGVRLADWHTVTDRGDLIESAPCRAGMIPSGTENPCHH